VPAAGYDFLTGYGSNGQTDNCALSGIYTAYTSKYNLDTNPNTKACALALRF
jgi:hypothetical protein